MSQIRQTVAASLVFAFAPLAMAQSVPISGAYDCKADFLHMMDSAAGLAMISAASCTLEGDDKNTVTFTNNVLFDKKGQGKLINSNGLTQLDGKPAAAFIGVDASWTLQMSNGEMTGYSASGVNDIVAGEFEGKQIHWSATPTGPDTMKISYEIKD